eukprot:365802-Chlamydomonas_euryale.AAC.21
MKSLGLHCRYGVARRFFGAATPGGRSQGCEHGRQLPSDVMHLAPSVATVAKATPVRLCQLFTAYKWSG